MRTEFSLLQCITFSDWVIYNSTWLCLGWDFGVSGVHHSCNYFLCHPLLITFPTTATIPNPHTSFYFSWGLVSIFWDCLVAYNFQANMQVNVGSCWLTLQRFHGCDSVSMKPWSEDTKTWRTRLTKAIMWDALKRGITCWSSGWFGSLPVWYKLKVNLKVKIKYKFFNNSVAWNYTLVTKTD